jgi:hypothetical protein
MRETGDGERKKALVLAAKFGKAGLISTIGATLVACSLFPIIAALSIVGFCVSALHYKSFE